MALSERSLTVSRNSYGVFTRSSIHPAFIQLAGSSMVIGGRASCNHRFKY